MNEETCGAQSRGSIQTELEMADPAHPHADSAVGGDRGGKRFITLSDATFFEPLNALRRMEKRLARAQRN